MIQIVTCALILSGVSSQKQSNYYPNYFEYKTKNDTGNSTLDNNVDDNEISIDVIINPEIVIETIDHNEPDLI